MLNDLNCMLEQFPQSEVGLGPTQPQAYRVRYFCGCRAGRDFPMAILVTYWGHNGYRDSAIPETCFIKVFGVFNSCITFG